MYRSPVYTTFLMLKSLIGIFSFNCQLNFLSRIGQLPGFVTPSKKTVSKDLVRRSKQTIYILNVSYNKHTSATFTRKAIGKVWKEFKRDP